MSRRLLDTEAGATARPDEVAVFRKLERHRIVSLVIFLVLLPTGMVVSWGRVLPNGWYAVDVWMLLCIAALVALQARQSFIACPRCGESGSSAWWLFLITRKCACCGVGLKSAPTPPTDTDTGAKHDAA
jgi:hypothetical protein